MDSRTYPENAERIEADRDRLRSCLTVIFKHKVRIVTVFVACLSATLLCTFLVPSVYQTKSTLLVKIGREYMNRPEVGSGGPFISVSQEEMTNSEIQILTNRDLIKEVVASIGLGTMYPALAQAPQAKVNPLDAATDRFAADLKVAAVKKSSVIQVLFRHPDPQVAARAVNTLVELYTEKHLRVFSDPRSSFLEKQLGAYERKLRETENSLQRFKQQHGVFSLEDQRKLLLDQRMALDSALKAAENSIAEQQKKMAALVGQRKRLSETESGYTQTERDRIIVEARSRLLSLQLEEQELLKKYTENNRLVLNIRNEIKMVAGFLKEQEEDISRKVKSANPVFQEVQIGVIRAEAESHSQQAKAETLRRQLRELDGALKGLDYREKELQKLKREQAINEKNYQSYHERTEEARVADDMNRLKLANVSVIEKAAVPSEPVAPRRGMNLALGTVLGLLAALGLAFLAEASAQGFSNPESVEARLGLPVLAVIPYREGGASCTSTSTS